MIINTLQHLNFREFDFPDRAFFPDKIYLILSGHRTGSNWLCRELWQTGRLGAPFEYFNALNVVPLAARFDVVAPSAFLGALFRTRTSPNGVFGAKILPNQWPKAAQYLSAVNISDIRILYLDRRDKLAQAVSLARALATNGWVAGMETHSPPIYRPEAIRTALAQVTRQSLDWERIITESGWSPLRLHYEDMTLDPTSFTARAADYIGVTLEESVRLVLPPIAKQADALSSDWIRRFRSEEG